MSLDDLVKVATLGGGLACNSSNMESLISDLKYQYAASASVAVSQAMLLQVLNKSRQLESKMISSSRVGVEQTTAAAVAAANNGDKFGRDASRLLGQVGAQITKHNHHEHTTAQPTSEQQHAPLDLSVRSPPAAQLDHRQSHNNNQSTRSRSQSKQLKRHQQQQQQPQQPLDMFRTQARQTTSSRQSIDVATAHLLHQAKLITSSTSPTSSGSTASPSGGPQSISAAQSPSARLHQDSNNNNNNKNNNNDDDDDDHHANMFERHNDVISSTNGRQRQRRQQVGATKGSASGKKQKGAKSHLCNFCGRSFSRSDMLTRHSRLHSGLKPYQCGKCYQVFSRSDHLSTHERTHTGEKPYQCNHCDYSACRRDMITRHMRTHTAAGAAAGQDGGPELAAMATRLKPKHRRPRKSAAESEDSSDKLMLAVDGGGGGSDHEDDEEISTNFEMCVTN